MSVQVASADTAVVRVTGEDAAAFLQGQCTADLRGMGQADALWLNRKGRVQAHTIVVREADGSFLLLCPHLPAEALVPLVTANVIADDVVAQDETPRWRRWLAWGAEPVGPGVRAFATKRYGAPAWDALSPLDADAPGVVADRAELEAARIRAGIPSVPADCGEGEFPQECGLDAWVSYTKGCYLGQEVMARIQSMGSLRRVLRRVESADGAALVAGADLLVAGKAVGKLRSVSDLHGLALVSLELAEGARCDTPAGGVVLGVPAALPAA